jgi:diacylglycerol kinase family enzyme
MGGPDVPSGSQGREGHAEGENGRIRNQYSNINGQEIKANGQSAGAGASSPKNRTAQSEGGSRRFGSGEVFETFAVADIAGPTQRSNPSDSSKSSSSGYARAGKAKTPLSLAPNMPQNENGKPLVVPVAVQREEHFQQLLQQGKLRHGSIIKRQRSSPVTENAGEKKPTYRLREQEGLQEFWVFIVHGLKIKVWEQKCPPLIKQLSRVKWKVYVTQYRGHASKLAHRACKKGATMIAAVGGDGTLNEVVHGVMGSRVVDDDGVPVPTLTVLPLGSSNEFHFSMGWDPDNFEDGMWRIGHQGKTALLDVGKVSCMGPDGPVTRHFINIGSVGLSGKVAEKVDKLKWFGAKLKYKVGGMLFGTTFKSRNLLASFDDGEWESIKKVDIIACCNGGVFGGGLCISNRSTPFDGVMDAVVLFHAWSPFTKLRLMREMSKSAKLDEKYFKSRECRKLDLTFATKQSLVSSKNEGRKKVPRGSSAVDLEDSSDDEYDAEEEIQASEVSMNQMSVQREESAHSLPTASETGRSDVESNGSVTREGKKQSKPSYGPYPLEVDGEVIGSLPASFSILPKAIKFRVH